MTKYFETLTTLSVWIRDLSILSSTTAAEQTGAHLGKLFLFWILWPCRRGVRNFNSSLMAQRHNDLFTVNWFIFRKLFFSEILHKFWNLFIDFFELPDSAYFFIWRALHIESFPSKFALSLLDLRGVQKVAIVFFIFCTGWRTWLVLEHALLEIYPFCILAFYFLHPLVDEMLGVQVIALSLALLAPVFLIGFHHY